MAQLFLEFFNDIFSLFYTFRRRICYNCFIRPTGKPGTSEMFEMFEMFEIFEMFEMLEMRKMFGMPEE